MASLSMWVTKRGLGPDPRWSCEGKKQQWYSGISINHWAKLGRTPKIQGKSVNHHILYTNYIIF